MIKYIIIISLAIFISCSENVNVPIHTDSGKLNQILVKRENKLFLYSYENKTEKMIFDGQDKFINSFDYNKETGNIFLILFEPDEIHNMNYISLAKLNGDGNLIEIRKDSSRNGESSWSYGNINVSKEEKYLALDGFYYEGGFFSVYDLANNKFIDFEERQYTEYVNFFIWDPNGNGIYVHSHKYLVYYDLINRIITMLDSPNIRDYLTVEYLLQNGYVGKRFNYKSAIGRDDPKFVNWNASGDKFLYINDKTLFLYDVASNSREEILSVNKFSPYYGKYFYVTWENRLNLTLSYPYFNNNDIIISFDSTILKTVSNLNDSLYYGIEKSNSISYFRPNWNNRFYSWDKYYFRKEISSEKFHLAEFDFHMWHYALRITPKFWFLVLTIDDNDFNEEEFIEKYNNYISEYWKDYDYFKSLNYPSKLSANRSEYEKYHLIDCRFQKMFLNFYQTSDTGAFKEEVYNLLREEDKGRIDSVFALMNSQRIEPYKRIIYFYAEMHNNFFNYYGNFIAKGINDLKKEYLIEILEDDWFYKSNGIYTEDYLRYKKYSYHF